MSELNNSMTVGNELRIITNLIKRQVHKSETIKSLTQTQGMVLKYISDNFEENDIFQKDIETEFDIRRSTATVILQLMEKNGFIKRECIENDKRKKKLILTQKAFNLNSSIEVEIKKVEDIVTKDISAKDLEVLFKTLQQIKKNLQQKDGVIR